MWPSLYFIHLCWSRGPSLHYLAVQAKMESGYQAGFQSTEGTVHVYREITQNIQHHWHTCSIELHTRHREIVRSLTVRLPNLIFTSYTKCSGPLHSPEGMNKWLLPTWFPLACWSSCQPVHQCCSSEGSWSQSSAQWTVGWQRSWAASGQSHCQSCHRRCTGTGESWRHSREPCLGRD